MPNESYRQRMKQADAEARGEDMGIQAAWNCSSCGCEYPTLWALGDPTPSYQFEPTHPMELNGIQRQFFINFRGCCSALPFQAALEMIKNSKPSFDVKICCNVLLRRLGEEAAAPTPAPSMGPPGMAPMGGAPMGPAPGAPMASMGPMGMQPMPMGKGGGPGPQPGFGGPMGGPMGPGPMGPGPMGPGPMGPGTMGPGPMGPGPMGPGTMGPGFKGDFKGKGKPGMPGFKGKGKWND